MRLDSKTFHVKTTLYSIEYHSGEPFRWKWVPAQALIAASTYDASPVLSLDEKYFGYDGNTIIFFDEYDFLTGEYYNTVNDLYYKINPKTEYVELYKVNLTIPSGLLNYTPPTTGQALGLYGGGFYNTAITDAMLYGMAPMKIQWDEPKYKCECGGKKTYNETNEHFTVNHSHWCNLVKHGVTK